MKCWSTYIKIMEIDPLSYNAFRELYPESGVEEFTLYSLGYWLQQNAHKSGEKSYEKLRGVYAESAFADPKTT